ncbi:HEAT repeat domain-containing protein [Massilia sp. BJB1822]|uniref:HEAT repeat domain-containing protein n=1 Tax=Massilia sp. BJB1822 TaxID=2744470 RepID=UPI001594AB79|nr:HEAT repeat domain-containing protein [Massilia sp. BJB1822]NVE01678.1 HEAT repeat domain-containing protein [Massilia sp. BJB1822]
MYEIYNKHISRDFSDDYWSDIGIGEAALIFSKFDNGDWGLLKQELDDKDLIWLRRCAETLSEVESLSATEIVVELISHPDDEVAMAAVDSLNAMLSMGVVVELDNKLMKRLGEIKLNSEKIGKLVIENMEKRFFGG